VIIVTFLIRKFYVICDDMFGNGGGVVVVAVKYKEVHSIRMKSEALAVSWWVDMANMCHCLAN